MSLLAAGAGLRSLHDESVGLKWTPESLGPAGVATVIAILRGKT